MRDSQDQELSLKLRQREEDAALKNRPSRARYDKVHHALERKWRRRELKADRMMREIIDELWDNFQANPYSWCGFYLVAPSGQELILGPHREKPACSPLPLHGVCGRALGAGKTIIVDDVNTLGQAHVECDPRNQSEIVVPVFDKDGKIWAVFDVDSHLKAAFDGMDQRWLETILRNFEKVGKPQ